MLNNSQENLQSLNYEENWIFEQNNENNSESSHGFDAHLHFARSFENLSFKNSRNQQNLRRNSLHAKRCTMLSIFQRGGSELYEQICYGQVLFRP
jgi:hypothetical protein